MLGKTMKVPEEILKFFLERVQILVHIPQVYFCCRSDRIFLLFDTRAGQRCCLRGTLRRHLFAFVCVWNVAEPPTFITFSGSIILSRR